MVIMVKPARVASERVKIQAAVDRFSGEKTEPGMNN
jgi:hypothetical protein